MAESFNRIAQSITAALGDISGAMPEIREILLSSSSQSFRAGGRPQQWIPSRRAQQEGGKTLVDTGGLAASITATISGNSIVIGSNRAYAAIHQFGGLAGRGHKTKIPARPYIVLQPEDLEDIRDAIIANYSARLGR